MSSVYIISALIVIACLTVFALITKQSIKKKQQEQIRLAKALEQRAQELVHMINAFPPQFLPKDIIVLIYRSLIDTYEQLTKLNGCPKHVSAYQTYCASMEKVITGQAVAKRINLQDPQQASQIKQHLNHLAKLLEKLNAKGSIDTQQHGQYHSQLKKLINQITVDNHTLAAKKAEQDQQTKLALHNVKMAEKVLREDGVLVQQSQQIASIEQKVIELNAILDSIDDASESQLDGGKGTPPQKDAEWKKNNVYD